MWPIFYSEHYMYQYVSCEEPGEALYVPMVYMMIMFFMYLVYMKIMYLVYMLIMFFVYLVYLMIMYLFYMMIMFSMYLVFMMIMYKMMNTLPRPEKTHNKEQFHVQFLE